jgi:glycine betaine/proline transport system permease protein
MMALSMVVITALIDGPGLGEDVYAGIQQSDVGLALTAGIAIVIMAILLDRLTTAASERADPANALKNPGLTALLARTPVRAALIGLPVLAIAAGTQLATTFPEVGFSIRRPVNNAVEWAATNLFTVTDTIKNVATTVLINPIQGFLTDAPWWLIVLLVVGVALYVGGRRPAIIAGICLLGIVAMEIWEHSMVTLAQVLVATGLTMAIGLAMGVAAARSDRFSRIQRPVLDALQTMPAFVYLIPALALFSPTRFTAIVAAVIYAVPAVIRLVEIGVRAVPPAVREAATAAGSTKRQLLWKVELPMARPALLVAANQGIVLVLAMVVIGGLVGGGGLGFDVVAGFAKYSDYGEGAAAAIACVFLGITLDRITQGAGRGNRTQRRRLLPAGAGVASA